MIHYISTNGVGDAWVANELHELDRAAIPYVLHAMRAPQSTYHSSLWGQQMRGGTRCLYPLPVLRLLWSIVVAPFLFGRQFFSAFWNTLSGERENWRGRIASLAHFMAACHWARLLRHEPVSHVHAQWAHSCATIGMYGTWLLGKSFSFTGHACDLYRDRVALRDKVKRAEFIVCISKFHHQFFLENGARPEQLVIVYCGIDPTVFMSRATKMRLEGRFRILAACRLVEKKGLRYLIDACRLLRDQNLDFECIIRGSGPLERELREHVSRLELSDRINITGVAIQQEQIAEFMHSGDVFCLPCVWAADGDVDGLPQMLMEAMACGLPVISTSVVGIPDLVTNEQTGLLVEPNNANALAAALMRLSQDHLLWRRLSTAGHDCILQSFDIRNCLRPLLELYRQKLARPAPRVG